MTQAAKPSPPAVVGRAPLSIFRLPAYATGMKRLFALAIPEFRSADKHWLDQVRSQHDRGLASSISPHFTLVFDQSPLDNAAFLAHLRGVSRSVRPIDFICRRAVVGTDHQTDTGYAFLVPDEGNSAIFRFRDMLHTAELAGLERPDIPYFPHITIGRFCGAETARSACADLNRREIFLPGRISALTVVAAAGDGNIAEVATLPLAAT